LDHNHHLLMDTFSEPYTRQGDDVSIDKVCEQIKHLEEEHISRGIPLSGRIIHVCHYLPITATLLRPNVGVLSPPATPPSRPAEMAPTVIDQQSPSQSGPSIDKHASVWSLAPRYGHAAMISGIRSLSQAHEQLIVGWTGDVQSPTGTDKIPFDTISQKERSDFESALKEYEPREPDADDDDEKDQMTKYIPVWLDDKVAHGHYDGYCKQSP
jgi:trehalose 6-phosphate synthase/phosphatase